MGFGSRTKVKAASPHHQFVIALHSPDGIDETGLLGCHPERMPVKRACNIVQRTFSGPVWKQELKELRRFRAIVRTMRQDFSALQTVWRSERDSNSQYSFFERASAGPCASSTPFSINNIHPEKGRTADVCEGGAVS